MPNLGKKIPGKTFTVPKVSRCSGAGSVEFFRYWWRLTEEEAERCTVRVYRTWPQVNLKLTDPNRKTIEWFVFEGKIPFDNPEDYREFFLKKFNSGGWKCILAETGTTGEIITASFEEIDLENYPPLVELKTVLWEAVGNKDYKRWLRQRNIPIPGDDGLENPNEGEDMKLATEALQAVTEQNTRLSETLIETVRESADAQIAAAKAGNVRVDSSETATNEAIKLMGGATQAVVEMITKNAGQQYDPFAGIEKVVSLLDARGSGNNETLAFVKIMMDSQNSAQERERANQREHFEFMKSILTEKKVDAAAVVPATAPKTLIEQIREYREMEELFGGGKSRRSHDNGGGGWISDVAKLAAENPSVIQAVSTPITALVSGVFQWLGAKNGQTVAAGGSPADVLAKANGTQPAQQIQQGPTPEQQQAAQREAFVKKIGRPLLIHLSDPSKNELSGRTWAEYILTDGLPEGGATSEGRAFYEGLRKMGMQGVISALSSNRELYEQITPFGERFPAFWMEFDTYDAWQKEQEQEQPKEG